jgi:hypothetical protein
MKSMVDSFEWTLLRMRKEVVAVNEIETRIGVHRACHHQVVSLLIYGGLFFAGKVALLVTNANLACQFFGDS